RDGPQGIHSKLPDCTVPMFGAPGEWQNNREFIDASLARLRELYPFQGELATFMNLLANSPSMAFSAPPTERAEGADDARDPGGTGQAEGKKGNGGRARRGPKKKTAAAVNTRLYHDWKAAQQKTGITKAEFILERGLPETALDALERGRGNVKR